jgi:hypothetical protein
MSAVARQVITHVQEAAGLDVQAGFLPHLPHQGRGQGLAFLDLTAGQAPGPAGISVLVQQQDAVVFDDNASHAHMHPDTLPHRFVS